MPSSLKRLRGDDAGQALAEYAIILALMAGLDRLERLTDTILAQSRTMLLFEAAVVATIVYLFWAPSNRT